MKFKIDTPGSKERNAIEPISTVSPPCYATVYPSWGKFIHLVGTKTKMNIGKYVFEQIVKHAKIDVVKCPIAFSTLLCGLMLDQHPSLVNATGIPEKGESPLTLHPKLFSVNHVPDIV